MGLLCCFLAIFVGGLGMAVCFLYDCNVLSAFLAFHVLFADFVLGLWVCWFVKKQLDRGRL